MIFIIIALISTAIGGTVCVDTTPGAISVNTPFKYKMYSDFGYDCETIEDYIHTIDVKVVKCLRTRWNLTRDDLANYTARSCCKSYEITRGVRSLVYKHCRKDEGKADISLVSLTIACVNRKRHQLSDRFCNSLSDRHPMGADCDHIMDSIAKGIDPYPTPSVGVRPPQHSGPNQSSTARPNPQSTAVSVLLAAIVVSIAVDVYGFCAHFH